MIHLLEGSDLVPKQIVLEVSERIPVRNYSLFADLMGSVNRMGFSIAVDNCGAGYSDLERIAHLRPDYVKLANFLVRDIDSSFVKQQIFKALRSMTQKIGAYLIASGIETADELKMVRDIGVDFVQGFLLGKSSQAFLKRPDVQL